jgi:hypothetical protein
MSSQTLRHIVDNINRRLPELPAEVRTERNLMARMMLHHTCAEYEIRFAYGRHGPHADWPAVSAGLTDGLTAVWRAPVTAPANPNDDTTEKQCQ